MVMPKKKEEDVRREQFPTRWSKTELGIFMRNAAARGMKPSVYLRWRVMSDRLPNKTAAPAGEPTRPSKTESGEV